MAAKSDVWQGTLALMVLKTLETLGPLHGYGIARRIEQVSGNEVLLNQGTIYAALVSGILRSHAPVEPAPAEMLSAVNYSLSERRIDAQFVSLIYAVWDDQQRKLQVANSGLPRPFYCHDGKIELIEATGLPLGLFDEADYDEFTFKAKPGDMFVFFSDGILDARNKKGDSFGRTRTEAIVAACATKSADCVVNNLFKAVTEHAAGVEAFDDQTVVAIKVKGGPGKRK